MGDFVGGRRKRKTHRRKAGKRARRTHRRRSKRH